MYDLDTLLRVATVPVGDGPWGVTVEGKRIAVTDTAGSTVHLIDAKTLEVRDVVEVGEGPWNARFIGGTLFVTLERAGEVVAVRHGKVIGGHRWAPARTASLPTAAATPSSPQ